jgi:cytidine deaminase
MKTLSYPDLTPEFKKTIDAAEQAAENAYAPQSHFHVGAAALLEDGSTIPGCNVENISYGLTMCAERTAVFAATALGVRNKIIAIGIIAYPTDPDTKKKLNAPKATAPCGACRQVLDELAKSIKQSIGRELTILFSNTQKTEIKIRTIQQLLPEAFDEESMES